MNKNIIAKELLSLAKTLLASKKFPTSLKIKNTTYYLTGKRGEHKLDGESAEYEHEHLTGERIWVTEKGFVYDENNVPIGKIPKIASKSKLAWGGDDYDANHYFDRYYAVCAQQTGGDEITPSDIKEMISSMKHRQSNIKKTLDTTRKNRPDADNLNELQNEIDGLGKLIETLKKTKNFESIYRTDGNRWDRVNKKWTKQ